MSQSESEVEGQVAPLLRWAGSKRRLLPLLSKHAPKFFERYYEPFAGSACLFWRLNPKAATLSDINPDLINFYDQVRRDPEVLHQATFSLGTGRQNYACVRSQFKTLRDPTDRAVAFWYLNRNCFNGLYRTNQLGEFNVPYGSKLAPLPSLDTTRAWARRLRRTSLRCSDFQSILENAQRGDFVYLDPPYLRTSLRDRGEYGKGALQDSEFDRFVTSVRLADLRGVKMLISYNVSLKTWFPKWIHCGQQSRYLISADAEHRRQVREYACRNYVLDQ